MRRIRGYDQIAGMYVAGAVVDISSRSGQHDRSGCEIFSIPLPSRGRTGSLRRSWQCQVSNDPDRGRDTAKHRDQHSGEFVDE